MASCQNDEEREVLRQHLIPIKVKLAQVKDSVESKASAHAVLLEHQEACNATRDNLARIEDLLLNSDLPTDQIIVLRAELDNARDQLRQLESCQPQTEAVMAEAGLVIKDPSTRNAVNIWDDSRKLLSEIEKRDATLKFCEQINNLAEKLDASGAFVNDITIIYGNELETIGAAVQVCSSIYFYLYILIAPILDYRYVHQ